MSHCAAAVHNDPLTIVFTFNAGFWKTRFSDLVAHAGSQGFCLTVGRTRGNDHSLKQRRDVLCVKHHNLMCLDILQRVHDGTLEFLSVFFSGGVVHRSGW